MKPNLLLVKHIETHPHVYELCAVILMSLGANVLTSSFSGEEVAKFLNIGASLIVSGSAMFLLAARIKRFYERGEKLAKCRPEGKPEGEFLQIVDLSETGAAKRYASLEGPRALFLNNVLLLLVLVTALWAIYSGSRMVYIRTGQANARAAALERRDSKAESYIQFVDSLRQAQKQ